jgi:hypothetical protein
MLLLAFIVLGVVFSVYVFMADCWPEVRPRRPMTYLRGRQLDEVVKRNEVRP